jgi:hypothetical protein
MHATGDLPVQALAARVGALHLQHVPFEFPDASDVLFHHHLQQGLDLLLVLMNLRRQVLVQLNHRANRPANIRIRNRRNINLR